MRPKQYEVCFGFLTLLALPGCFSSEAISRDRVDDFRDRMMTRAAFELDCPWQSLEIVDLMPNDPIWAGSQLGVRGCGRRAVYLWDGEHNWMANTAAIEWSPEGVSAPPVAPSSEALPGAPPSVGWAGDALTLVVGPKSPGEACGVLQLSGQPIDEAALQRALHDAAARNAALRLTIAADRGCRHAELMHIVDLAKSEGVAHIGFAVEPSSGVDGGSKP
ncbi:MAG: hypothetical protein JST54_00430 [Deltaproteobacteria bacterium]|nr:hypothetical protein [Deltaproteobacteria bacterium]